MPAGMPSNVEKHLQLRSILTASPSRIIPSLDKLLSAKPEDSQLCEGFMVQKLNAALQEALNDIRTPNNEFKNARTVLQTIQYVATFPEETGVLVLLDNGLLNMISDVFISTLHFVRDKPNQHTAKLYEEVLQTIGDIADSGQKARGLVAERFCDRLLQIITSKNFNFSTRLETLKTSNIILERCPAFVRQRMQQSPRHKELMCNLANLIPDAGDYEFQVGITECLFRLSQKNDRANLAQNWFSQEMYLHNFLAIRDSDFETDCRNFLLVVNNIGTGSVITIPAQIIMLGKYKLKKPNDENYEAFWVDFNTYSGRLSVFCEPEQRESQNEEDNLWETITIWSDNVKQYAIQETEETVEVILELKTNAMDLIDFGPKFHSRTSTFHFNRQYDVHDALKRTFGSDKIYQNQKKSSAVIQPVCLNTEVAPASDPVPRSVPCIKKSNNSTNSQDSVHSTPRVKVSVPCAAMKITTSYFTLPKEEAPISVVPREPTPESGAGIDKTPKHEHKEKKVKTLLQFVKPVDKTIPIKTVTNQKKSPHENWEVEQSLNKADYQVLIPSSCPMDDNVDLDSQQTLKASLPALSSRAKFYNSAVSSVNDSGICGDQTDGKFSKKCKDEKKQEMAELKERLQVSDPDYCILPRNTHKVSTTPALSSVSEERDHMKEAASSLHTDIIYEEPLFVSDLDDDNLMEAEIRELKKPVEICKGALDVKSFYKKSRCSQKVANPTYASLNSTNHVGDKIVDVVLPVGMKIDPREYERKPRGKKARGGRKLPAVTHSDMAERPSRYRTRSKKKTACPKEVVLSSSNQITAILETQEVIQSSVEVILEDEDVQEQVKSNNDKVENSLPVDQPSQQSLSMFSNEGNCEAVKSSLVIDCTSNKVETNLTTEIPDWSEDDEFELLIEDSYRMEATQPSAQQSNISQKRTNNPSQRAAQVTNRGSCNISMQKKKAEINRSPREIEKETCYRNNTSPELSKPVSKFVNGTDKGCNINLEKNNVALSESNLSSKELQGMKTCKVSMEKKIEVSKMNGSLKALNGKENLSKLAGSCKADKRIDCAKQTGQMKFMKSPCIQDISDYSDKEILENIEPLTSKPTANKNQKALHNTTSHEDGIKEISKGAKPRFFKSRLLKFGNVVEKSKHEVTVFEFEPEFQESKLSKNKKSRSKNDNKKATKPNKKTQPAVPRKSTLKPKSNSPRISDHEETREADVSSNATVNDYNAFDAIVKNIQSRSAEIRTRNHKKVNYEEKSDSESESDAVETTGNDKKVRIAHPQDRANKKSRKRNIFSETDDTGDARSEVSWITSTARKKKQEQPKTYLHGIPHKRGRLLTTSAHKNTEESYEAFEPIPKETMPATPKQPRKKRRKKEDKAYISEDEEDKEIENLYYQKGKKTLFENKENNDPLADLINQFDVRQPVFSHKTPNKFSKDLSVNSSNTIREPFKELSVENISVERFRWEDPDPLQPRIDADISTMEPPRFTSSPLVTLDNEQDQDDDLELNLGSQLSQFTHISTMKTPKTPMLENAEVSEGSEGEESDEGISNEMQLSDVHSSLLKSGPSRRHIQKPEEARIDIIVSSDDTDEELQSEDEGLKPRQLFNFKEADKELVERLDEDSENEMLDINMEDVTCDSSLQTSISSLLQTFGVDIQKNLKSKKDQLEKLTKDLLKSSQKQLNNVWMTDHKHRESLMSDFKKAIFHEILELEGDIETYKGAEEKIMAFFKQQQSIMLKARTSQQMRLKKLVNMQNAFSEQIACQKTSRENQHTSKEILQREMNSLQKRILQQTQQQEMMNVKKSLQSIFF